MTKIAIAEDAGEIAEHLGKAPAIHFFDLEDGKIVGDELVECSGQGHEYMLSLLDEKKADVLVCGNLGKPAIDGLLARKVTIYPALMGDVKEAVYEYLDGSLPQVPVQHLVNGHSCCHHHAEEEESCHCCCQDADGCGCHEE